MVPNKEPFHMRGRNTQSKTVWNIQSALWQSNIAWKNLHLLWLMTTGWICSSGMIVPCFVLIVPCLILIVVSIVCLSASQNSNSLPCFGIFPVRELSVDACVYRHCLPICKFAWIIICVWIEDEVMLLVFVWRD